MQRTNFGHQSLADRAIDLFSFSGSEGAAAAMAGSGTLATAGRKIINPVRSILFADHILVQSKSTQTHPIDLRPLAVADRRILTEWSNTKAAPSDVVGAIDFRRIGSGDLDTISDAGLAAVFSGVTLGGAIKIRYRDYASASSRWPSGPATLTPAGLLTAMAAHTSESALVRACELSACAGVSNYLRHMTQDHRITDKVSSQTLPWIVQEIEAGRGSPAMWDAACLMFEAQVHNKNELQRYLRYSIHLNKIFKSDKELPDGVKELIGFRSVPSAGRRLSKIYNQIMVPSKKDSPRAEAIKMAIAYGGFLACCQREQSEAERTETIQQYATSVAGSVVSAAVPHAAPGIAVAAAVAGPLFSVFSPKKPARDLARAIVDTCKDIENSPGDDSTHEFKLQIKNVLHE